MMERGDKVVTLPERLDKIETSIVRLENRVNRLFGMLAVLVGIGNAPVIIDALTKLIRG